MNFDDAHRINTDDTLVSISFVDEKGIHGGPPQNYKIYAPLGVTIDVNS